MATKGSRLQRAVEYFREAGLDEARVAFTLVKEIVESRLVADKASRKSQAQAASKPRPQRAAPTRKDVIHHNKPESLEKPTLEQPTKGIDPTMPQGFAVAAHD